MEKFFEEVRSELRALVQAVQVIAKEARQVSQNLINSTSELLDNTDIKELLHIRDTKLGQIKHLLPGYNLDGKDYYFKNEIIAYIKANPKKYK
ncbi:hypothetical protein [Sphingobacterium siyangense]|uniref:hypothetical protein n=1 Tax=Sphingobacterium siyangense TaxID=459529 RepID=UPI002FDD6F1E